MNSTDIKNLAEIILDQTFVDDWYFYLIFFALAILGSFLGSYIRGYGAEKAKYSAIESSLSTIEKKVALTTEISEKIRSDIEIQVWKTKERQAIKREKLEDYMTTIYLVKDNTHLAMENKLLDAENSLNEHYWNKANMLQTLYLPELRGEHNEFRIAYVSFSKWLIEGMKRKQEEIKKGTGFPFPDREYMDSYSEVLEKFNPALLAIDEKASELAEALNT